MSSFVTLPAEKLRLSLQSGGNTCSAMCFTHLRDNENNNNENTSSSSSSMMMITSPAKAEFLIEAGEASQRSALFSCLGWFANDQPSKRNVIEVIQVRNTELGTLNASPFSETTIRLDENLFRSAADSTDDEQQVIANGFFVHSLVPCYSSPTTSKNAKENKQHDALHNKSVYAIACVISPRSTAMVSSSSSSLMLNGNVANNNNQNNSNNNNNVNRTKTGIVFLVPRSKNASNHQHIDPTLSSESSSTKTTKTNELCELRENSFKSWLKHSCEEENRKTMSIRGGGGGNGNSNKDDGFKVDVTSFVPLDSISSSTNGSNNHQNNHNNNNSSAPTSALLKSTTTPVVSIKDATGTTEDVAMWCSEFSSLLVGCEGGKVFIISPSPSASSSTLIFDDSSAGTVIQIAQTFTTSSSNNSSINCSFVISCINKCFILEIQMKKINSNNNNNSNTIMMKQTFSVVSNKPVGTKARVGVYGGCNLAPLKDLLPSSKSEEDENEEQTSSSLLLPQTQLRTDAAITLVLRPNLRMFLADSTSGAVKQTLPLPANPRVPGVRSLRDITRLVDRRIFVPSSSSSGTTPPPAPSCLALCVARNQVSLLDVFSLKYVAVQQLTSDVLTSLQEESSQNNQMDEYGNGGAGLESARMTSARTAGDMGSARTSTTTGRAGGGGGAMNSLEQALLAKGPYNIKSVQIIMGVFMVILLRNGDVNVVSMGKVTREFCEALMMIDNSRAIQQAAAEKKKKEEEEEQKEKERLEAEAKEQQAERLRKEKEEREAEEEAKRKKAEEEEARRLKKKQEDEENERKRKQEEEEEQAAEEERQRQIAEERERQELAERLEKERQEREATEKEAARKAQEEEEQEKLRLLKEKQKEAEEQQEKEAQRRRKKQEEKEARENEKRLEIERENERKRKIQQEKDDELARQQAERDEEERIRREEQEEEKRRWLEEERQNMINASAAAAAEEEAEKKEKERKLKQQQQEQQQRENEEKEKAEREERERKQQEKEQQEKEQQEAAAAAAAAAAKKKKEEEEEAAAEKKRLQKEKEEQEKKEAAVAAALLLEKERKRKAEQERKKKEQEEKAAEAERIRKEKEAQEEAERLKAQEEQLAKKDDIEEFIEKMEFELLQNYKNNTTTSDSSSTTTGDNVVMSKRDFFSNLYHNIIRLCARVKGLNQFNKMFKQQQDDDNYDDQNNNNNKSKEDEIRARVSHTIKLSRSFSKLLPELFRFAQTELSKPLNERRLDSNLFLKEEVKRKISALVIAPLCFFEFSSLSDSFQATYTTTTSSNNNTNNNNEKQEENSNNEKSRPNTFAQIESPQDIAFASATRATFKLLRSLRLMTWPLAAVLIYLLHRRRSLSMSIDLMDSFSALSGAVGAVPAAAANNNSPANNSKNQVPVGGTLNSLRISSSTHPTGPPSIAGEYLRKKPLPGCEPLITRSSKHHPLPHLLSASVMIARCVINPSVPFFGATIIDAQEDTIASAAPLSPAAENNTSFASTATAISGGQQAGTIPPPKLHATASTGAQIDFENLAKNVERCITTGDGRISDFFPALPDVFTRATANSKSSLTLSRNAKAVSQAGGKNVGGGGGASMMYYEDYGEENDDDDNGQQQLDPEELERQQKSPIKSAVNIFEACFCEPDAIFIDYSVHTILTLVYLPFINVVLPTKATIAAWTQLAWDATFDQQWIEWSITCPRLREEIYYFFTKTLGTHSSASSSSAVTSGLPPIQKRLPSGMTMSALLCDQILPYLVQLRGDPRANLCLSPILRGGLTGLSQQEKQSSARTINHWEIDIVLARRFCWCIHVFMFEYASIISKLNHEINKNAAAAAAAQNQNNNNSNNNNNLSDRYALGDSMSLRSSVATTVMSNPHNQRKPSSSSSTPAEKIPQSQLTLQRRLRQTDAWIEELITGVKTFFASSSSSSSSSYDSYGNPISGSDYYASSSLTAYGGAAAVSSARSNYNSLLRGLSELACAFNHGRALVDLEGFNSVVDRLVAVGDVGALFPIIQYMGDSHLTSREWTYILLVSKGAGLLRDAVHLALAVQPEQGPSGIRNVKNLVVQAFPSLRFGGNNIHAATGGDPQLSDALDMLQKLGA